MPKLILLFAFAMHDPLAAARPADKKFKALIAACADLNSGDYRVMPYLAAAEYLQSLKPVAALELMERYAKDAAFDSQIIVLTRMLFEGSGNAALRRPMIGAPSFVGGSTAKSWPNEPIAIVKGVPFLITNGYVLGGKAESSFSYLTFTVANGRRRSQRFTVKTAAELAAALTTIVDQETWPRPAAAKTFLASQIKIGP